MPPSPGEMCQLQDGWFSSAIPCVSYEDLLLTRPGKSQHILSIATAALQRKSCTELCWHSGISISYYLNVYKFIEE